MSDDVLPGVESPESRKALEARYEEYKPSEWESALLSIALFGGLILFGVGCFVFGWS